MTWKSANLTVLIAKGNWLPKNWLDLEHAFLFPGNAITSSGEGIFRVKELRVISDFGAQQTPDYTAR